MCRPRISIDPVSALDSGSGWKIGDHSTHIVSIKTKFIAEKVARGGSAACGITAERELAGQDVTIKANTQDS